MTRAATKINLGKRLLLLGMILNEEDMPFFHSMGRMAIDERAVSFWRRVLFYYCVGVADCDFFCSNWIN
jgi:hypothetical protein